MPRNGIGIAHQLWPNPADSMPYSATNAAEREGIEALWRLTALPRAEFEVTFGAMLAGFWRYAAGAQGEAWAALRRETVACVVAERFAAVAGRVTAPGWRPLADDVPETAVPAGAPPPRPFGALLLARLADEAGLGWLGQEGVAADHGERGHGTVLLASAGARS